MNLAPKSHHFDPSLFQLVSGQDYDVADISCSFGRTTAAAGAGGGGSGDGNADADPEGLTALLRDE